MEIIFLPEFNWTDSQEVAIPIIALIVIDKF